MCQADCAAVAALSQPRPQAAQGPRPSARAATAWATKWELAVPLVAIGALVSGLATPTESAALTAGYAVLTQALAHRELGWRLLGRCLADCAMPIGGVMLILGMALALANYLVDTGVPDAAATWVQGAIPNKYVFLLVLVPLLLPLTKAYGIHPLHFGIIFLAATEVGFLCPPAGLNIYFASAMFNKNNRYVAPSVLPALGAIFVGTLLIALLQVLSTGLPQRELEMEPRD